MSTKRDALWEKPNIYIFNVYKFTDCKELKLFTVVFYLNIKDDKKIKLIGG